MSARTNSSVGRQRRAIVIGGGLTAMLTAQALSTRTDVLVIERDSLPEIPEPRKSLPQAHHVHVLWSGGAEAIAALLPDVLSDLESAGARRIPLTSGMVGLSPAGWFRRWQESHYAIACHRDLFDWVIRRQVLGAKDNGITVMQGTTVLGLAGSADTVTGVDVRTNDGRQETLLADLVVDASGKGSQTPVWLNRLGAQSPPSREVDSGLVYASRLYQAPHGLPETWPIINVQADPRGDGPGQAGVILPIEDGRWLVTLSGTRGGEPTIDPDAFGNFALGLRHPIVGEMIKKADPLGPVHVTRMTANRRRFYEKTALPANFLALGDAVAAYNPTYGHGMSVAAQSALTLRNMIDRYGYGSPGFTRRVQKAIARHVGLAWTFAVGTDVFYDGATEGGPTLPDRMAALFVDRLTLTATGSGRMARDLTDVMTLQKGPEWLFKPSTLVSALRGPLKPQLTEPPLSPEEIGAIESA
ncbi:NAD(P)/FAD-dependent oxidoreductase [Streptomyces pseudovenezuelae]|uniref:2-polyprenyl-6-methoxyphenol hydroxylase-like FAD-dependent oxidoreductase n=1 Tax=Streptomyces pseudovenezuelae TaxID=67350 RepID=A0ABT6LNY8_9ACTN|nr:pyridine nucleotide-disulfide oxidoreductase [Streptomyces pseudovenezuelae]MDH6218027.1 2-polyprenyl-6-methoxyphenol hydroxylase-like FAD-dependent oxidoreductase [Streptomyces pseudovenezuelae]